MAKTTNALASEQKAKRPVKSGVKFARGTKIKCANVHQERKTTNPLQCNVSFYLLAMKLSMSNISP